jgi:hypothetical protein
VPRLEEILALARDTGKGIEFDIKTVRNYPAFFDLVASYGVLSRSYFAISGDDVDRAQAYNPDIRVIFNIDGTESPNQLYEEARRTAVFGSRREKFTPEKIAAIHDGCAFVIPHSYDETILAEADELRRARADGADGAQIDQPDVIAHAAERRVPATLVYEAASRRVCLRNSNNTLGIPRRLLSVFRGLQVPSVRVTDREGCVGLPQASGEYWVVHLGDAAVGEVTLRLRAP